MSFMKRPLGSRVYLQQLTWFSEALQKIWLLPDQKKKKLILLHDKARWHLAKTTRERIENHWWKLLSHRAYSPDLARSGHYLLSVNEGFLFGEKLRVSKNTSIRILSLTRKLLKDGNIDAFSKMREDHTKRWKLFWWLKYFYLFLIMK